VYITGQYQSTSAVTLKNANGTNSSVVLPIAISSAGFLVKYDSSGTVVFGTTIDETSTDIGYGVTTDSLNNVYITGQYTSSSAVTLKNANGTNSSVVLPIASSTACFLIKYDSSGTVVLGTIIDGTYGEIGFGVTTDSLNNVYITGQYDSESTITLKNGDGTNSSVVLPITSSITGFLIKYV
jgi:hypothetical protein